MRCSEPLGWLPKPSAKRLNSHSEGHHGQGCLLLSFNSLTPDQGPQDTLPKVRSDQADLSW